jgi:probable HAF family extracellular repeat protein
MRFVEGSRAWLLLGLLLPVSVFSLCADAASFRGLDGSCAYSVSSDGSFAAGQTGVQACYWDADGTMIELDRLPGVFHSSACGISADGSVVVGWATIPNVASAFHWSAANGMVDLGRLPGASSNFSTEAMDISDDGLLIVGHSHSTLGVQAFRWVDLNGNGAVDPNETLDNQPEFGLGDLEGGLFFSEAFGVSSDGSVVVGYSISESGDEAFRWTAGGMRGLGDLPGGVFSSVARAVSGDGLVVVGESFSSLGGEAFRWTEATGMVGLGDLAGGDFSSQALGASGDGSVVVGCGRAEQGFRAFIWDETNGMRDLRDVLIGHGLADDLSGWELTSATDISADGLTIVGYGFYMGEQRAWIATIPEPASVLVIVLGAGLALTRRRRT